jgi:hypothetical protein
MKPVVNNYGLGAPLMTAALFFFSLATLRFVTHTHTPPLGLTPVWGGGGGGGGIALPDFKIP